MLPVLIGPREGADELTVIATFNDGDADIVTANLFLHHFTGDELAPILSRVAGLAPLFVACEPRRAALPHLGSRLLWAIGCNDVSRHDAVVSVEAGFAGTELSAIWPEPDRWRLHEQRGTAVHPRVCRHPQRFCAMAHDAMVIGGGPAGATAALLLARAGWSVALVEKDGFPRRKVCGEFISAASMPLLQELGLLDEFVQRAGPPVRRVGLFARDATLAAPMPLPPEDAVKWGRALGREHLDCCCSTWPGAQALRSGSPGRPRSFAAPAAGYQCTVTADTPKSGHSQELGRSRAAARIVIAAHGSWQNGTLPTQPAVRTGRPTCSASRRTSPTSDLPCDLMPLLAFPGGYGGMVHTDGGRVSLSCCIRRDTLERCRSEFGHLRAPPTPCCTTSNRPARASAAPCERPRSTGLARGGADPARHSRPPCRRRCSASAIAPARPIRSLPRASAWRCNRRRCCAACWLRCETG